MMAIRTLRLSALLLPRWRYSFQLTNPLGTRRMQTSASGQPETDIQSLPFGDQLNSFQDQYAPATADDATPLNFTGKERDTESGNDYFGARYYGSSMGRMMSPDPSGLYFADPTNPQSLNLYSYVLNNPLVNTDPTGLDCVYFTDVGDGIESVDQNSNSGECGFNGGDWVNETVQSAMYFSDSDTWGFESSDSENNYLTYANAPGTEQSGIPCSGNCDTANGYFQSSNSLSDLTQSQSIQQLAQGIAQQTAWVQRWEHTFGCTAEGAVAAGASFVGAPPGMINPGDPLGSTLDAAEQGVHNFAHSGGVQATAYYAYQLTKSPAVEDFVGENLGKLVPFAGQAILLGQSMIAANAGINQFRDCN